MPFLRGFFHGLTSPRWMAFYAIVNFGLVALEAWRDGLTAWAWGGYALGWGCAAMYMTGARGGRR